MEIELKKPTKVVIVKEVSLMATSITVVKIIEIPNRLVQVIVKFTTEESEQAETIVLWQDKEYKPIGTYTMDDVKKRLEELL